MTLKRLLVSRSTVLTVIGLLTGMIVVASLVPQAFMTPADRLAAWRGAHPVLAWGVAVLGLHRVYTHPVFAALLAAALLCLGYSAAEQFRTALRKTRAQGPPVGGSVVELPADLETVARTLRSMGYLTVRQGDGERRLVQHPWGYWGNFLLHAGLAVVVTASAYIGVTQQRGVLFLVEGEAHAAGAPWFEEENGVAAGSLTLPFSVRLDHLEHRFWPTFGLKSVTSTLSLLRPGERPTTVQVGINELHQVDGLRIYQGAELGHVFRVGIQEGGIAERLTMLIPHPSTPDTPGVNEFQSVVLAGDVLRAKYFVDAELRSFEAFNPLLILRVDRSGKSLGEVTLRPGAAGRIGPYEFRLEKVSLWTRLFFVRIRGIGGVFAGFFVIALGGVLHYFTPPREAALRATEPGATRLVWRAARFAEFYADEPERICAAVRPGGPHG